MAREQAEEKTGTVREALYPGIATAADGSEAAVWVESHISQGACAYPITPSTPMGDRFGVEYANGTKNLWDEPLQFLEPESEHSSASACEGFALAGGRVTNFTSGQGLILMKEVLYVIAGKRLPVVFHIGARALTSQSLNIHAGHDDVMGVADCGWGIVFARNSQEVADLALIARRAAEDSETPFMVAQDGFITTHTVQTARLPEPELMRRFVGAPSEKLRKLFDPENPLLSGPVQNQDAYMTGKVAQRYFYDRVGPALKSAMEEYGQLTGRPYDFVRGYRMEDAQYAIVGLGSMMETAEATVDFLRARGWNIGALTVHSFRPFPSTLIAEQLAGCEAAVVVERADVPLAQSNPLTMELKAALADSGGTWGNHRLEVYSAVAGLGGRDVRPGHFLAAVEEMARGNGKRFFVLGVRHEKALEIREDPDVRPPDAYSLRGHSVGGFGSVTTNKILAAVGSDLFGLHAQAFPKYGSEKKGLPTSYYLTLASEPVRLHGELRQVEFVAVQDPNAFLNGNPLEGVEPDGIIYLQSQLPPEQIWESLPPATREIIRTQRLHLFALDALRIARESSSRADLQTRMQGIVLLGAFLRLTPFRHRAGLDDEAMFASLEKALEKYFGKRGRQVIEDNLKAARRGFDEVVEVVPPAEEAQSPGQAAEPPGIPRANGLDGVVPSDFCKRVIGAYHHGAELELEADPYVARSLMPAWTGRERSFRHLAPEIPAFIAPNCVGCMDCVNECPDTAILAKVVFPETLDEKVAKVEQPELRQWLREQFVSTTKYNDLVAKRGQKGGLFGIFIDPDKCKGCGECVEVCGSHEALKMVNKEGISLHHYDLAMDLYHHLPETPGHLLNEKSLGDMMLAGRTLLYAGGGGSCMGCGEATAVRMMLAATGFVYGKDVGIVAATGCNTVYGSTYPYNPFGIPWTNSLFENAPADAMGIRLRWNQEGHLRHRLWVLGGDGAMYDIGFQSLSRMLASGLDIKALVLDTQVYSNTGGQNSTATFTSQDAKMAAVGRVRGGKSEHRKEIGQILMMHPHVFVAATTPAHINHFYKSVMGANEFPGPAVVIAYSTCQPEHGVPDDRSMAQAKLAVETRTFPLFIYDPRKGQKISDCLSLQGNPTPKTDWYIDPHTNQALDFVGFARTEGRFARHFDSSGLPDEFIKTAQEDRLENWRHLQELGGLR